MYNFRRHLMRWKLKGKRKNCSPMCSRVALHRICILCLSVCPTSSRRQKSCSDVYYLPSDKDVQLKMILEHSCTKLCSEMIHPQRQISMLKEGWSQDWQQPWKPLLRAKQTPSESLRNQVDMESLSKWNEGCYTRLHIHTILDFSVTLGQKPK